MSSFDQRGQQVGTQLNLVMHDSSSEKKIRRYRQKMLGRVEDDTELMLKQLLREELHIPLELGEEVVSNTLPNSLPRAVSSASPFLLGDTIGQWVSKAGGNLLILGEAGAGKTVVLLLLTQYLLKRARLEESAPVPVVLHLPLWNVQQQPFAAWLKEQLWTYYRVPYESSQFLMESKPPELILLLDGLDEVISTQQKTCLEKIQEFLQEYMVDLVVNCRENDYRRLTKDEMHRSILPKRKVYIYPLSRETIEEYLLQGGEQLVAVRTALNEDQVLSQLITTPLMLTVLCQAYRGRALDEEMLHGSLKERRHHLFEAYVDRMLKRERMPSRGRKSQYTREQTMQWLTWLAWQLHHRNQAMFYLEQLQADWLPKGHARSVYNWVVILVLHLIGGLSSFLIYLIGLQFRRPEITILAAEGAFFVFLIMVYMLGERSDFDELFFSKTAAKALFPSMATRFDPKFVTLVILGSGFIGCVQGGLFLGLLAAGNALLGTATLCLPVYGRTLRDKIEPAEIISWSWRSILNMMDDWFGKAGVYGALSILIICIAFGALREGLSTVLGAIAIFILARSFFRTQLDPRMRIQPNQGIHNSGRNAVFVGALSGLLSFLLGSIILLIFPPFLDRGMNLLTIFLYSAGYGIMWAVINGLRYGGITWIKHYVLRTLLWWKKCTPYPVRYVRFLEYAAGCILLYRRGGGYLFLHRYLLEYFKSLNSTPATGDMAKETRNLPSLYQQSIKMQKKQGAARQERKKRSRSNRSKVSRSKKER